MPLGEKDIAKLGVAGLCAIKKAAVNVADVHDDLRFNSEVKARDAESGYRTRQALAMPLLSGITGGLVGVVEVTNKLQPDGSMDEQAKFGADDELALSAIMPVVSLAFENTQLRARVAEYEASRTAAQSTYSLQ